MPISQNHHSLFQSSSALDKLNLFQSLLDAGSLNSNEALALLNSIHAELERPEGHDRSVYTKYALVMESFRIKMPNIYQDISTKWQQLHSALQTKADHEATLEDNEPGKKILTVASLLSKLPQKIDVKKGINKQGMGKHNSEEVEGEAKEEMEGEEVEEKEEAEEKEEIEKGEEKKEETKEEEEKEEGEEEEKEETKEKEEQEEGEEEEKEETKEEEEQEEGEEEEEKEETKEKEEEKEEEETEENEKEEGENESSEQESVVEEEHNSREEADHMAREAAEAAEESEHAEVETEVEPLEIETPVQPPMDLEETDASFGGEAEPPMEMPEA